MYDSVLSKGHSSGQPRTARLFGVARDLRHGTERTVVAEVVRLLTELSPVRLNQAVISAPTLTLRRLQRKHFARHSEMHMLLAKNFLGNDGVEI